MNQERRDRPTYPLESFREVFPVTGFITKQAKDDAFRLGFDTADIEQVIRDLSLEQFYKSMPAKEFPDVWQDVYKAQYMFIPLYIKLQLRESGGSITAVVVAFKEDKSPR